MSKQLRLKKRGGATVNGSRRATKATPQSQPKAHTSLAKLQTIRLDDIQPDPANRPIDLTQARFEATRKAVKARGVVEPVVVYHDEDGGYQLVDGHLRIALLRNQGVKTVPALVYGEKPSEFQLRVDQHLLNTPPPRTPFEKADQLARIVAACGGKQATAGKMIGESRKSISQYQALQRLGPKLRAKVERHNAVQEDRGAEPLTFNHLYQIALGETPSERNRLAQLAMDGATTKALAKARDAGPPDDDPVGDPAAIPDESKGPAGKRDDESEQGADQSDTATHLPSTDRQTVSTIPLGDYEHMGLEMVDWTPANAEEVRDCIAVGLGLARLIEREPPESWPHKGVQLNWDGKADEDGEVRFVRRKGLVCLRLRQPERCVRRMAILISAIFTGETLQHWD